VLAALWWAWTVYAWLTNTLEPEEGQVRAGMFGAMVAMLVVALAVPRAFGADAVLFRVAYLIVRLLNLVLYAIAGKRDPDFLRTLVRFAPTATLAPLIILSHVPPVGRRVGRATRVSEARERRCWLDKRS
jgi:low temperature requirement protein LtrA